jgi:hypothetical protein
MQQAGTARGAVEDVGRQPMPPRALFMRPQNGEKQASCHNLRKPGLRRPSRALFMRPQNGEKQASCHNPRKPGLRRPSRALFMRPKNGEKQASCHNPRKPGLRRSPQTAWMDSDSRPRSNTYLPECSQRGFSK